MIFIPSFKHYVCVSTFKFYLMFVIQGVGPCHAAEIREEDFGEPSLIRCTPSHDISLAASSQLHRRAGATNWAGLWNASRGFVAVLQTNIKEVFVLVFSVLVIFEAFVCMCYRRWRDILVLISDWCVKKPPWNLSVNWLMPWSRFRIVGLHTHYTHT